MTTPTQDQVQDQAPRVKTPLEAALSTLRNAGGKLSKVESRASEFDKTAADLNIEIAELATGARKQTAERNMLVVVKEQNAAASKAEKIRKSGAVLAGEVVKAKAELDAIIAVITAAYEGVELPEDEDEDEIDTEVDGDNDIDGLNDE